MNGSLLPKRALVGLTVAHAALAFFAIFGPLLAFTVLFGRSSWRHVREGGFMMFAVLAIHLVALVVVGVLGAFTVRGKSTTGGFALGSALAPAGLGLLGAFVMLRRVQSVVSSESIDPSQRARIAAMGISETSNLLVLGYLMTSFALFVVCVAAALSIAAIDTPAETPSARTSAAVAPLAVGGLFLVVAVVARAVLGGFSAFSLLPLMGIISAVAIAASCGRIVSRLAQSPHVDDAAFAWRSLGLAAFGIAGAVLFVDLASSTAGRLSMLEIVAGQMVSPAARARILHELIAGARWRPVIVAIDTLACLAIFAAPVFVSMAGAKRKVTAGTFVAATGVALTSLLILVFGVASGNAFATAQPADDRFAKHPGIELPRLDVDGSTPSPRDRALFVEQDGRVTDDPGKPPAASTTSVTVLAPDARLTFDALARAVGPALGPDAPIVLVVAPRERVDTTGLGEFAPLAGPTMGTLHLTFETSLEDRGKRAPSRPSSSSDPKAIAVLFDGDRARIIAVSDTDPSKPLGAVQDVPVAAGSYSSLRAHLDSMQRATQVHTVLVLPRSADTMQTVAEILHDTQTTSDPYETKPIVRDFVLTPDRATIEKAIATPWSPALPPSLTRGVSGVNVAGRLPPEVVQRLLRVRAPAMLACLSPTGSPVNVRFVIDDTGATAHVSVTGGDATATARACVSRVLQAMSFPAPEGGGVVTVSAVVRPG